MIEVDGIAINVDLSDLADRRRTALLVYDMQVGICSQIPGSDRVIERCLAAVAAARGVGMRIVFSRHLSNPASWMGATQYRTAMAWQRTLDPRAVKPWFPRDAPATAIVADLAPTADDLVIDKFAMSAFEGTPLAYAMKDCGLTGLAICGIALEIGIEPTVRHATDLGFVPIVLTDACGAGSAEAGARTLDAMRFIGEAILTEVDPFTAALAPT